MPSPNDDIIVDVFSGTSTLESATCFFVNTPRRVDLYKSPRPGKGLLPRLWDVLSSPSKRHRHRYTDYDDLPLDGEEGELIDDEACFINATEPTRIGICLVLPVPCF